MNMEITERIRRDEWLKALGAEKGGACDLSADMDEAEREILKAARPRAVYRLMARDEISIPGYSLSEHLAGCEKVAVMAVTLGIEVDNIIRKAQVTDMALAVMLDSGASVLVEQLCDDFERYIDGHVDGYTTGRFSPGYGDSPLELQKAVVSYVDGGRRIGLNVTASNLLVPRKSVTALIGVAEHPVEGRLATCDECVLREKCRLRKEGRFCGDRSE